MPNAKQLLHEYLAEHPQALRVFDQYVADQCERLRTELEDCPEDGLVRVRAELQATRQLGRHVTAGKVKLHGR